MLCWEQAIWQKVGAHCVFSDNDTRVSCTVVPGGPVFIHNVRSSHRLRPERIGLKGHRTYKNSRAIRRRDFFRYLK